MKQKKFLVIRVGNLGDVLMSTPVFSKLRKVFPDSRIDFMTADRARIVVDANKNIDNILIYGRYKRIGGVVRKFFFERKLSQNMYDVCFVLEQHPQYHRLASNIMGANGLKIGLTSVPATGYLDHTLAYNFHEQHAIETHLFLLRDFLNVSIDQEDYMMNFIIPHEVEQNLETLLPGWKGESGKYFVIHPGCTGNQYLRTWSLANYKPVIHYLRAQGYRIFLTGAKTDKHAIDEIMKDGGQADGVEAFLDRHLYEVAFLIKHAQGVLSPDTGIMHLARAMRVPVVALFGPSNPLHTGCIGPGQYVQIRNDFKCGPCNYYPEYRMEYKQFCLNEGRPPACMRSITVEQVMDGLRKILNNE